MWAFYQAVLKMGLQNLRLFLTFEFSYFLQWLLAFYCILLREDDFRMALIAGSASLVQSTIKNTLSYLRF